jgi:ribosome-associated heat shock protein Hsp15
LRLSDIEATVDSVRMDKWLWAARFFKTRALASKACELGRVEVEGKAVKAARAVKVGDVVRVTNEGGVFVIAVLGLSEVRGPAAVARTLYQETDESKEMRLKAAAERKAMGEFDVLRTPGRPTKRDRRLIHRFSGKS